MTELSFTKSFLTTLDERPIKLPPDYVFDPRTFDIRLPFTLPQLPHPPHPRLPKKIQPKSIPGSLKSITLHLRSARNPVLHFTLPSVPLETTTIQELKEAVQERVQTTNADVQPMKVPLDKIKILWNRKPVQKRTVAEILGSDSVAHTGRGETEFGVMILGGATVLDVISGGKPGHAAGVETSPGEDRVTLDADGPVDKSHPPSTRENKSDVVLQTAAFWNELQDFLEVRIKDQGEAVRLKAIFRNAWNSAR